MKTIEFKRLAVLLTLVLVFAVFAACSKVEDQDKQEQGSVQNGKFPVEITDMLGQTIRVEKEPEKLISITPSSTETLFALGLGDKIVAVSNWCDYPEEAKAKDKAGDYWQPNLELITAAEPDLVFIGESAPPDVLEKFKELGIKVVALEATDLEGTYQSIINTGKLTGKLEEAEKLVKEMKAKADEIQAKVKDAPKRSTYFVVSYGSAGNYTGGPGSFVDELIKMAGGHNIASDLDQAWAEFSLERLVEEDPEVVIVSERADIEEIKSLEGYKELTAVKENNLKLVDENLVMRPGPRLIQGLEQIAKAIHPEIFE